MSKDSENMSLGEAAGRFLASLSSDEGKLSQQEIYKFVRWYGWERPLSGLTAPEVGNYAEHLSLSDADHIRKLELVRAFLIYARKEAWTKISLATYLKAKKGKVRSRPVARSNSRETVSLTQEGYDKLEAELASLRKRRPQIIEEMQKAAADKDFRENAPLEAAREERGYLEGRIGELEETLKSAAIIGEGHKSTIKVSIGDKVILCDMTSNEELCYTIVGSREANPSKGKISEVSPIGKAIVRHRQGEVVGVLTPACKFSYRIEKIEL